MGKTLLQAPRIDGLGLLSKYRGAIMGFSALWIFVFHEWQLLGTGFAEAYIKRIGFVGVDIFLLLSGIGLTFAIGKGNILQFYGRRLQRVYLPFLLVGLCNLILKNWTGSQFWGNVTGWNFYVKTMYSFLWFVPAIMSFYLAFPLYYKVFTWHHNPLHCLLTALSLWLLLSIQLRSILRYDLWGFTNRIPVFLVGIYLGWRSRQKERLTFSIGTWVMLLWVFILGLYLAYVTNYKNYYLLVPTSNCCLPNLMIAVSLPFLLAGLLELLHQKYVKYAGMGLNKLLGFWGMFSLEFYCVQEALGLKLIPWFRTLGFGRLMVNLLLFLIATVAAWCLHMVCKLFWKLVGALAAPLRG